LAGKKQHFIPRHYLKPFTMSGDKDQIWMYRRGAEDPVSVSRNDAAAQRHFYSNLSEDGLPTLDDLITEYEERMHKTVDVLRAEEIGAPLDSLKISEVITHLTTRSFYLRGMFENTFTSIATAIDSIVQGKIDRYAIQLPKHEPPLSFEEIIREQLDQHGLLELSPLKSKTLARLLYFIIRENPEQFLANLREMVAQLVGELSNKSALLSRRAQTSALMSSMAPEKWIEKLAELDWMVVASPNNCSILPDCVCVAFDGEQWASLTFIGNKKLEVIILPLTPDRLAVGVSDVSKMPDLSNYNQIAAQSSHTFFLSSQRLPELAPLHANLGGHIRSQVSDMTDNALMEAIKEAVDIGSVAPNHASNQSWWTAENNELHSFQLQFYDFENDELAEELPEVLKALLSIFGRHLPIHNINAFIFANNYRAALASVETGVETSREPKPTEADNLLGVCTPVKILVGNEIKTTVVCRSGIAAALVSEGEEGKTDAISAIMYCLASAALHNLMLNKFPTQMLSPISDQYEGALYQYTGIVFAEYFCTSMSYSKMNTLEMHENLALLALDALLEDIPYEHHEYRHNGDLDSFFKIISDRISNLLLATARLIGAQKSQEIQLDEDSQFRKRLEKSGLFLWYQLFKRDLLSFDAGLENWGHFEELFFVNRHFERIAARFSVYLEPNNSLSPIYVYVTDLVDIVSSESEG